MSGRARLIIAAVVAVLVCALFYFVMVKGRQSELATVRQQVTDEEAKGQQLQIQLAHLRSLQQQAPKLEAQLSKIRRLVPQDNEIPNFIFEVQEAANAAGVSFLQVSPELPKPPPEGATLAEVRISIGADGGYFAVQDFLRRLDDLDRALRIDTISLTGHPEGTGGGTSVALQLATRVFFELPPTALTTVPGTTVPAPVTTPVPATTP
jgi:type IV pilus assembly protein PilO